jgi:NAD(P)H dehydrogenase (quinone)
MKKNILIVTAHPSSLGFTHKIAEAYKAGSEEVGNTVEILDLYKTDLKQDFLRYEIREDMGKPDATREAMQAKITWANEIVFVHPMWWVSMPAIMKNWIDVNMAARFAFRYIDGNPVGLLKGKSSRVFITCDGAMWKYWLILKPFWTIWFFGILNLCGLKVRGITTFSKKFKRTDAEKEAFLDKVKKSAK